MNLFTTCKSCRKDTVIKSSAATRGDLQMEKGDEFDVKCEDCGNVARVHVNDVYAEINNNVIYLGIGISVVVTLLLLTQVGLIGTISLTIPFLFWQKEVNAVKSFNSYKVSRKK